MILPLHGEARRERVGRLPLRSLRAAAKENEQKD